MNTRLFFILAMVSFIVGGALGKCSGKTENPQEAKECEQAGFSAAEVADASGVDIFPGPRNAIATLVKNGSYEIVKSKKSGGKCMFVLHIEGVVNRTSYGKEITFETDHLVKKH